MSLPLPLLIGAVGHYVSLLHHRLRLLGVEVPSAELSEDRFGPGTEAAIRSFQMRSGLSGSGMVDKETARALGLPGQLPQSIQGVVCLPDGTPLVDVAVSLHPLESLSAPPLAEARSDANGSFTLAWPGQHAGLVVRAEGCEPKELAALETQVTASIWVRLTRGGVYRGVSRFTSLMSAITPKLAGATLQSLASGDRKKLASLAIAAEVSSADVARVVLAHRLAEKTSVAASVFFALFSQQLPRDLSNAFASANREIWPLDEAQVDEVLSQISRHRGENIAAALDAALAANSVSGVDLAVARQQLHALRLEYIASKPFRVGKTPFRDVLSTVLPTSVAQAPVLAAVEAHGSGDQLWPALESAGQLTPAQLADLRFALTATVLVRNHLPLLRHVQQLRASHQISEVRELARLDESDWAALIRQTDPTGAGISFLSNLRFPTLDERIAHFARLMSGQSERQYPTAAFAGRMHKHLATLGLVAAPGVQQFLDAHPDFDLRSTHIDRFLSDVPDALGFSASSETSAAIVADLKKVQRVYKLTRQFDHAKAMLSTGLTSSQAIYAQSREQFAQVMTAAGVSTGAAAEIHARAEQMHATTLAMLGNFNGALTNLAPSAVAQPVKADALQPMLASFPSLQSLFGANDYCACEHCRSLHGPASYFVDLLQFLRGRTASSLSVRDRLFARRPDLKEIELSCDNTNIVMPYVDLVCEILEDAVSPSTTPVLRARQTSGSAEELRASPRFVNHAAYNLLRTAVFPMEAPFDLWTAEIRAFLQQLGVPRHELMRQFQISAQGNSPASPTALQIAGERIGFNPAALAVTTTPLPAQPWTHWGLQESSNSVPDPRKPDDPTAIVTGTWLQILAFVPIFLHRTHLSHRELVQVLATRFVNPGNAIKIVVTPTDGFISCDTGKQSITGWTAAALSRFSRFVRLWRQLGCTIWDLDKLLLTTAVGNNAIDGNTVAQLARVQELSEHLKLPWDELLGLWAEMDRHSYLNVLDAAERMMPSVYARRFRDVTVMQSSPIFVEDPALLQGLLSDGAIAAGISAALDLSADDVQKIRVAAALGAANAPLTLANLSVLLRHAILAEALHLSVSDLLIAIEVIGIDPFSSPRATLEWIEGFETIKSSKFSLHELQYLLRQGALSESGSGISDARITGWLDELRREMVRVGAGIPELVVRRLADLLVLDASVISRALAVPWPGLSITLGEVFADPRFVAREADGSFAHPAEREGFEDLFWSFHSLHKMRVLLTRWRVSTQDAVWLLNHSNAVGWLSPLALASWGGIPLRDLDMLLKNIALQQQLVSPLGKRLFDFVLQVPSSREAMAAEIGSLGGWAGADVLALASHFGWSTGADIIAGGNVSRIRELMSWSQKLGTSIAETLTFLASSTATEAAKLRQLTKAKFSLDKWYEVAAVVQDKLREQKRAALVAWLLSNPNAARNQRWTNMEELYGFFLIDPEMAPISTTTRIKQATASVQLYVQRCFLQREPGVTVDEASDSGWKQWEWMKRFRLWEANRKIFLYPENWVDPAQRRDKSVFFQELENELQQRDVTSDVAEDALLGYLHRLDEVSHLEICGVCDQFEGQQRILHVIGRTRKAPHAHYYRQLDINGVWSPWSKIDVEITAEHVVPVFWNRRLHLFWIEFNEKSVTPSVPIPVNGGGYNEPAPKYWQIQLSWTERRQDHWMPKRQSKRKQLFFYCDKKQLILKAPINGRKVELDLYQQLQIQQTIVHEHLAQWSLSAGGDEPSLYHAKWGELPFVEDKFEIETLSEARRKPHVLSSNTTDWYYNSLHRWGNTPSPLTVLGGHPHQEHLMLNRIGRPTLMVNHQLPQFLSRSPFFLSDSRRTFFVEPRAIYSGIYYGTEQTYTSEYKPSTFYHPFVDTFLQELSVGGVDALYQRNLQLSPDTYRGTSAFDFAVEYGPSSAVVQRAAPEPRYPVEVVDFSREGAYSSYNWELFFHAPLLVAKRLADNQRFEDAMRWFHYVFNPTATSGGAVPQRYWVPKAFFHLTAADYAQQQIERLLQLVSQRNPELEFQVRQWRENPFDPHLIAALRPVAYQKAVVMQYIETLIAWADQLFRLDTVESINEATQLYLMANELLGPRPQNLRAQQPRLAKTYGELSPQLDAFSNAAVDIENVISIPPPATGANNPPLPQLHTFYFCIPPNDKLLACWGTVADRLFKIRHSMNLAGVSRQLALYEPPIDPGLLARATAAGVELSTVIADAEVSLSHYRFASVWQRAYDLCQDVRSLGASILTALEHRDAEEISRVRATQEVGILQSIFTVKKRQLEEAKAQYAALGQSRDAAIARRDYYSSRDFMNPAESAGMVLSGQALAVEAAATLSEMLAAAAHALPSMAIGAAGFGGTPFVTASHGGQALGNVATSSAGVLRSIASTLSHGAGLANTLGSYQRRSEDWDLQHRIAEKDILQLDRQLLAAELRIALHEHELEVHLQQTEDAKTTAELLSSKFTNRELYDWSVSQLSTTYFQAYQLAYDLARRAGKSFAFELGTDDPGFIQFGTWDSLHKGLHAGDKLLLDLRRLQTEHMNRNHRELELTKHVSLLQLDPLALVKLRQTGECFINLPESVFDLDQPGHYLRRLKTVSVTLPCVTGPYTGINATLTLLSHATRRTEIPGPSYPPDVDADGVPLPSDARFSQGSGAVQSVALSTGNQDSGLFEVNFHDERYLPFEGLGAIGHWRLELPKDCNRFDVSTLSDVVMHLRYTARDGGSTLRAAARQAVTSALPRAGARLLSARSEAPDAWARLWAPAGSGQRLDLVLGAQHFPHVTSDQQISIESVSAYLLFEDEATYAEYQAAATSARLKVRMGFAPSDGSPPAASATFVSEPSLGQVPLAAQAFGGPVGAVVLAFLETDLAAVPLLAQQVPGPDGSHHRLRRDVFDDVQILVRYKVEVRP